MPAALEEAVRRELEREAAEGGGRRRQVELTQPQIGEEAGGERHREQEQVPRDDRAEERVERPEREPVGPAAEDGLRLDERLEAVRVHPRGGPALELVADEPEAVGRLQVVAGGGLAVAGGAVRHELGAQRAGRRERGDDGRDREERHEAPAGPASRHADGLCRMRERARPARGGAPRSPSRPGRRRSPRPLRSPARSTCRSGRTRSPPHACSSRERRRAWSSTSPAPSRRRRAGTCSPGGCARPASRWRGCASSPSRSPQRSRA